MADRIDSEKVKLIRILRKRAKRTGTDLYELLSRKDEFYGRAIKAQRSAGLMTLICGSLGSIITVAYTIYSSISYGINIDIVSYVFILAIILGIIITISLKTSSLMTTPTVMLVLTIIQLIITLLLFGGIIPLIAVIYNIIALVRWSTYRNWYEDISVAYYRGEKPTKRKNQKVNGLKDVYDFSSTDDDEYEDSQRKPVGLIVSLIFAIIIGIGGCIGCFYWGRNGGWIDGYATGKDDGYAAGKDEGYSEGYARGKDDGYNEGLDIGYTWQDMNAQYEKGYNDGYRKAGCIIYGVYCD